MKFKGVIAGIIILLVGLAADLTIPQYFPNYAYVTKVYKTHMTSIEIPAKTEQIVLNFTITNTDNAIIAFITKGSANISVIDSNSSKVVVNQVNRVGIILSPGNYYLAIINNQINPQNITYTYGIFNAGFISSFYSGLGVLSTALELIIIFGAIIIILSLAYQLLSRKKGS